MLSKRHRALARESVFLKSLPVEESEAMLNAAVSEDFKNGETIFLQGDAAEHFFIVLEGWLKLYRVDGHGYEAVVSVFSQSQSFAEAVALSAGAYPVSAQAVTDLSVARISATHFVQRMTDQPKLALALVASTFLHLHDLVGQVEHLKARTGVQRVAEFLLELCANQQGPCTVKLPYDKVLISGRLGMTPEYLSRNFLKLKDVGVNIERYNATISDVGILKDFCSRDRKEF